MERGYGMENMTKKKMYDVAVIGVGPAGLSALVYLLEAHLNVIAVGPEVGGQINNTPEITERGWGQPLKMEIGNEIRMKYGQTLNTLHGYSLLFSLYFSNLSAELPRAVT